MSNFPGNPYEIPAKAQMPAPQAIYQAIMVLAFEQRTANLQRQAEFPMIEFDGMSEDTVRLVLAFSEETGKRLGL